RRLGARLLLGLLAEREPDAVEQPRVESPEHVGLVLVRVDGTGEEPTAAVLDDSRVVARGEPRCARPLGEGEQLGEAETPVAADARVRGLSPRIAPHERRNDGAPELLAEVERYVREPQRMAGLARRNHSLRRAAGAFGVRRCGVRPET